jgi:hypothetical protein
MSRVSISKSYAVLVGMESYTRARKKVKRMGETVAHGKDKLLHPEKVKEEEEAKKDKSESAEKERQHLEKLRLEQEKESADKPDKSQETHLATVFSHFKNKKDDEAGQPDAPKRILGMGPEDGVPPPEGRR